ncbi:diguanylate cyclase [Rathayibacter sp. YIM 133350]|uniref:sensor domain-containing protein n=1 Tax=Rathayibacter sp. YIM 133350 TaxID=3131992 RepID=UPI00307FB09C
MTEVTPAAPPRSVDGESVSAALYDHAPCGLLCIASDGTITRANSTLLQWLGYRGEELDGSPFVDVLDTAPRLFYETRFLPVLNLEGEVREISLSLRRADGSTLPVLMNAVKVGDEVRAAIFDATQRQDYERELLNARREAEASAVRIRVLQQASLRFDGCATEQDLASVLAECAREAFAAAPVTVLLAADAGAFYLAAGELPTRPGSQVGDRLETAGGPASDALRHGEVVSVSDRQELARTYPQFSEQFRRARVEAVTATPLLPDGAGPLGVLLCFFGRGRPFPPETLELMQSLARQASQTLIRIRLQERLERMALYDQLTGIANRRLLIERLGEVLESGRRNGRCTALVFLDLDGFKPVNDQLGHAVGDDLLRVVAARIRSSVRPYDTAGRFGGDEFIIVCDDTDAHGAAVIAERVRAAIEAPIAELPDGFTIRASIGIAVHDHAVQSVPISAGALIHAADDAMFESKRAGGNQFTIVDA